MNLRTLKREALQAAKFRGHKMLPWGYGLTKTSAHCERCGRGVYVTLHPAPNDIAVGGEAVALNCETGKGE